MECRGMEVKSRNECNGQLRSSHRRCRCRQASSCWSADRRGGDSPEQRRDTDPERSRAEGWERHETEKRGARTETNLEGPSRGQRLTWRTEQTRGAAEESSSLRSFAWLRSFACGCVCTSASASAAVGQSRRVEEGHRRQATAVRSWNTRRIGAGGSSAEQHRRRFVSFVCADVCGLEPTGALGRTAS